MNTKVIFSDYDPTEITFKDEEGKQFIIVPPAEWNEISKRTYELRTQPENSRSFFNGLIFPVLETVSNDTYIIDNQAVTRYEGPKTMEILLLSPDGITIHPDIDRTNGYSVLDASQKIVNFINRYVNQGYYSSNQGRISLAAAIEECVCNAVVMSKNV